MIYNGLLVKNKALNLYLRTANTVAAFLLRLFLTKRNINNQKPKILLSNIAHIGDLVLTTCVFDRIKQAFPDSEIGFICNSTAKGILQNHPAVNDIYYLDHWNLNRGAYSFTKKYRIYLSSFLNALRQIKQKQYDIAIDFYNFYPNAIPLIALANIPVTVGYPTGGYKDLLTQPVAWTESEESVMKYHHALVDKVIKSGPVSDNYNLAPVLKTIAQSSIEKVDAILAENDISNFLIFHCGAGNPIKIWDTEKWQALADKLNNAGYTLIFTGSGTGDEKLIADILDGRAYLNLCNKLSLDDLSCLVNKSIGIVSADTLIVHVGAAFGKPVVVISCYKGSSIQFVPMSKNSAYFGEFGTLADIGVEDVYKKVMQTLTNDK